MQGAAAAAARGEEVDDDELVAGAEEGVGEVSRGLDLPHVGLPRPLLPPPHRLGKRQVHLLVCPYEIQKKRGKILEFHQHEGSERVAKFLSPRNYRNNQQQEAGWLNLAAETRIFFFGGG
jgi:hypothetical protein